MRRQGATRTRPLRGVLAQGGQGKGGAAGAARAAAAIWTEADFPAEFLGASACPAQVVRLPGLTVKSPNRIRGNTRRAAISEHKRQRALRDLAFFHIITFVASDQRARVDRGAHVEVTLVRIAPRSLDDDNFIAACKHLRDGVARGFGVSDNDPRISFRYEQRRATRPRQQDIHIEIRIR